MSEHQKDEKNKTGKEDKKGAKRSLGEWEEFAKRIKIRAEERAEESMNPEEGMDISHFDVAREIGAVHTCESDSKFSEEVFELINSARGESMRRSCITTRFRAR